MRTGGFIQTYTGGQYWPLDPAAADVNIVDVAHALSLLCRYTGQIKRFYSVAEHSIHVASLVEPRLQYAALLHDAQEAYINDLSKPFKLGLPDYNAVEAKNEAAVSQAFGIPMPLPKQVKWADGVMLWVERRQLFDHPPAADWGMGLQEPNPYPNFGRLGWSPKKAEQEFLRCFREYVP